MSVKKRRDVIPPIPLVLVAIFVASARARSNQQSPLLLLQELLVNIAYLFFSCMCVHFPIHAPSLQITVLSVQWAVLKV